MLITSDKFKKALIEIEKVVYGKIKHLNNQARILHIGEILSKVIVDGKFIDETEDDEEMAGIVLTNNNSELDILYKEFFYAYRQALHFSEKVDEIYAKIDEKIKEQ